MIILASASPRRKELLSNMGFAFEIMTADLEEETAETGPGKRVEALSLMKAKEVFGRIETEKLIPEEASKPLLVIAADTLVFLEGKVLGKPADPEEAYKMLSELSGNVHQVCTGVTLIMKEKGKTSYRSFYEETHVSFCKMSDREIRAYIATGEPMDKAGAYGIQGKGAKFVEKIEGDYSNVVGLPVSRLYREMKNIGYIRE